MQVLIVNHNEVRQWLTMRDCIDVMADCLKMLSSGNATNPLRSVTWLPDKNGVMATMPAYLGENNIMGVKAISVFPGNLATEYDTHQGSVMLFETQNGRLLSILDATEITAIRTAAVSALATRLLAREDAKKLTILGSGTQARTHLEAILQVRDIARVRIWSRDYGNAQKFAKLAGDEIKLPIKAIESAREAVTGADVICTTTSSAEPVLFGDWLTPGVHINAVGACTPGARELDSAAVLKTRLFVDRLESTINEAGDFLFPKNEGALDESHILGEIGDLLLSRAPGREADDDLTLFKSLGLAVEDVAAAHFIYKKMTAARQGTMMEIGGLK